MTGVRSESRTGRPAGASGNWTCSPFDTASQGASRSRPTGTSWRLAKNMGGFDFSNLGTGTFVPLETQTSSSVNALAFSPASDVLAAGFGYGEGAIRLWDARLRGTSWPADQSHGRYRGPWPSRRMASNWSPRAMTGRSGSGTSADHTELRCLQSSREGLTALALLPDGRTLVSGGSGGRSVSGTRPPDAEPPVHTNLAVSLGIRDPCGKSQPAGFAPGTLDPRVVRRFGLAFTPDSRSFITMEAVGALAVGCPLVPTRRKPARPGQ